MYEVLVETSQGLLAADVRIARQNFARIACRRCTNLLSKLRKDCLPQMYELIVETLQGLLAADVRIDRRNFARIACRRCTN